MNKPAINKLITMKDKKIFKASSYQADNRMSDGVRPRSGYVFGQNLSGICAVRSILQPIKYIESAAEPSAAVAVS